MDAENKPADAGVSTQFEKEPENLEGKDKNYFHELREENKKIRLEKLAKEKEFAEIKKKADELDKLRQDKMVEDGKLKELLDEANKKLAKLPELETRIAEINQQYEAELDGLKKNLTTEDIKLLEEMSDLKIEKRLTLARKLSGSKSQSTFEPARGGQGSTGSIESITADYVKADGKKKMEMLFVLEKSNPGLYKQLLTL